MFKSVEQYLSSVGRFGTSYILKKPNRADVSLDELSLVQQISAKCGQIVPFMIKA